MTSDIPEPITFNPVKHHFRFLLRKIEDWRLQDWQQTEEQLRVIGNNLLDFYLGDLSINAICSETLLYFKTNNLLEREIFSEWIQPMEYKKIELSDKSQWVIKKGDSLARYLHIHPGKYSVHTIRVRAATLKTVIAMKIHLPEKNAMLTLEEVNHIRAEFLELSPVKQLQPEKGILKLWQIFNL